jgi:hypothetical protein
MPLALRMTPCMRHRCNMSIHLCFTRTKEAKDQLVNEAPAPIQSGLARIYST